MTMQGTLFTDDAPAPAERDLPRVQRADDWLWAAWLSASADERQRFLCRVRAEFLEHRISPNASNESSAVDG